MNGDNEANPKGMASKLKMMMKPQMWSICEEDLTLVFYGMGIMLNSISTQFHFISSKNIQQILLFFLLFF